MELSKYDYDNLNHYGAVHILLVIRIFFSIFLSLGNVTIPSYRLHSDYATLPLFSVLLIGLLIACIALFFLRRPAFIVLYIITAVCGIALNIWVLNFIGAAVSVGIESLFFTYLLISKRSKVVFRTVPVTVLDHDYVSKSAPFLADPPTAPQTQPPAPQPVAQTATPGLDAKQIDAIVKDLLTMNRDDAIVRIGGMQISEVDKKIIYHLFLQNSKQ